MPVIQTRAPGGATEAKQDAIITALDSVGLDAATLAALEQVTATISNFPADYPDVAAALLLTAIKNAVEGTLDVNVISSTTSAVSGTVALDATTLAALETINAVVSGSVELGATTLAALESVTSTVSNFPSDYPDSAAATLLTTIANSLQGTLSVSITNLPAVYPDGHSQPLTKTQLDSSTVAVSGSISVNNFPTSTEISNDVGNPVPVSGTVSVNEPVTVDGSVAVTNLPTPQTDALTDAELRASPVPVSVNTPVTVAGEVTAITNLAQDVFSNLITGQRDNQIEVHFDDSNYTTTVTNTFSGGGQGGSAVQTGGQVNYFSGTSATGRAQAVSKDVVKYRPLHEVYAAWTASFIGTPAANSWQRVGMFTDTDGIFVGYEGTTFGITWRNGGVVTSIPQASWHDKCDGSVGSRFTRNGVPEALNPAFSNLYLLQFGWLGAAGFRLSIMSPDWEWVPVYTLYRPNTASTPFLSNADLPQALDVGKSSGASNLDLGTNCWAAGTTSAKGRLSDPITSRSLVENVRAVITGETTAGGGGFVNVKVNPSGALTVDATVSNFPASTEISNDVGNPVPVSGPATDAELRASALDVADSAEREYTHVTADVTSVGDTTIYTPAAGKSVRLRWIFITPSLESDPFPKVTVKLGSSEIYKFYGSMAKRQLKTGTINSSLIINLSVSGNVAVTAVLEEV